MAWTSPSSSRMKSSSAHRKGHGLGPDPEKAAHVHDDLGPGARSVQVRDAADLLVVRPVDRGVDQVGLGELGGPEALVCRMVQGVVLLAVLAWFWNAPPRGPVPRGRFSAMCHREPRSARRGERGEALTWDHSRKTIASGRSTASARFPRRSSRRGATHGSGPGRLRGHRGQRPDLRPAGARRRGARAGAPGAVRRRGAGGPAAAGGAGGGRGPLRLLARGPGAGDAQPDRRERGRCCRRCAPPGAATVLASRGFVEKGGLGELRGGGPGGGVRGCSGPRISGRRSPASTSWRRWSRARLEPARPGA